MKAIIKTHTEIISVTRGVFHTSQWQKETTVRNQKVRGKKKSVKKYNKQKDLCISTILVLQ